MKGVESYSVTKTKSGLLKVGGVTENRLVGQFPGARIPKPTTRPKHLTEDQMGKLLQAMRIRV
jgi:hypothetical protein